MSKKSLILVAVLAIALVGCNKEKEEASVPAVGQQQEQVTTPVEQTTQAGMQQQAPVVEAPAPVVPAPEAPVAPVVTPEAPVAPSTLVMSNEAANPAPVATPEAPVAPAK